MTDAREIDGFCTDCGNWTDLHGPIGDRRCRCGSGRVAVPPAGIRIIGKDEVDALQRALGKAEEGAGTLPAKEAVKLRPAGWHALGSLVRAIGRKAWS